jgi:hypothetical protein
MALGDTDDDVQCEAINALWNLKPEAAGTKADVFIVVLV